MRRALPEKHSISRSPTFVTFSDLFGLTDVTFIHAENQSRDQAAASLESAGERITELLADQNRLAVAF